MISKKVSWKSYKEICRGEPKKVNLGYNFEIGLLEVENNSLVHIPLKPKDYIYGKWAIQSFYWEVLDKFFGIYNIEPNWLDCNYTWGWFDEDLGGWTGCMGKV